MRPLVAVVIPTFSQTIEQRISFGISEALREAEVDVLFAAVGYISEPSNWHDSALQTHRDIAALKPSLVIFYSGGLAYKTSPELFQRVLAQYDGIKCIHMGQKELNSPSVLVNNYQGMKDLIKAILIKRPTPEIVFISGPVTNSESELRKKALMDVLTTNNLDTQNIPCLESNFTSIQAQHIFIEHWTHATVKPNLVICANDLMAKGVIDALKGLGLECPKDCWVTGFDDFEYAQFMKPALTTVHYPAYDLGVQTGRVAQRVLNGETILLDTVVNALPKFRTSTNHISNDSLNMRERLTDLWHFIQERDATARKFAVVRQIHSQHNPDSILDDIDSELDALAIDEMTIFKRDKEQSQHFTISQKKQNTDFGKKDISNHFWVFCPLETEQNNYGYTLTRCDRLSAELVEFFTPQISEIHHRQIIQSKNDQLRNQNEMSERMASLGRLVAGVAHEVNTPIGSGKLAASSLMNSLSLLKNKLRDKQMTRSDFDLFLTEAEEHADLIYSSLDRAAGLISNFKLVSVDQSVEQTRTIDLGEYITLVLSSLKHEFKNTQINIETQMAANIHLNTYPGIVAQLLTNILLNARLHGFNNGLVSGTINIALAEDQSGFVLTISDNGHGASQETIDNIFEPFYTTARAQGGSGLGMYIVFNIATQKLKWDIEIDSVPSKGFAISFRPKKESFA